MVALETGPWLDQFGGTSPGTDYAHMSYTDTSGNVYVATNTALSGSPIDANYGIFLSKYGTDGTILWTHKILAASAIPGATLTYPNSKGVTAVLVDASGNVIVAGNTGAWLADGTPLAGGLSTPFLAKYDSAGNKLWAYNVGYQNNIETSPWDRFTASAAAVDADGNIYLSGAGLTPGATYVTDVTFMRVSKFTPAGTKVWNWQKTVVTRELERQRKSGGCADSRSKRAAAYINTVLPAANGGVVAIAATDGDVDGVRGPGDYDILVAKINVTGADAAPVVLFGTSKYDAALGALDSVGNLLLGGSTAGNLDGNTNTANGSGSFGKRRDRFVSKLDAAGARLWTTQFGTGLDDYASAIKVDTAGNAYLAGFTYGNGQDAFVAKVSATGVKQWVHLTSSAYNDRASTLALDVSGNVFITGYTEGILTGSSYAGAFYLEKLDTAGGLLWIKQAGLAGGPMNSTAGAGKAITTDLDGYSYVVGDVNGNLDGNVSSGWPGIFISKLDPHGAKVWTRVIDQATSTYHATSVAVDTRTGDVYAAGSLEENGNHTGAFAVKFDSEGNQLWKQRWKGWPDTLEMTTGSVASGIAVDAQGNLYVTGSTVIAIDGSAELGSSAAQRALFLTKVDATGSAIWTKYLTGSCGTAVALDRSGNPVVVGTTSTGTLPYWDNIGVHHMLLRKYDTAGNLLWAKAEENLFPLATLGAALGEGTPESTPTGVAVDAAGNIAVSGYSKYRLAAATAAKANNAYFFVAKFSATGAPTWIKQDGSDGIDQANSVTFDTAGNVLVTGTTSGTFSGYTNGGGSDLFFKKYASNGSQLWVRQLGTAGDDAASGVASDGFGNLLVSGTARGALGSTPMQGISDAFVMKIFADGTMP
jgi:hypothetical protein